MGSKRVRWPRTVPVTAYTLTSESLHAPKQYKYRGYGALGR